MLKCSLTFFGMESSAVCLSGPGREDENNYSREKVRRLNSEDPLSEEFIVAQIRFNKALLRYFLSYAFHKRLALSHQGLH